MDSNKSVKQQNNYTCDECNGELIFSDKFALEKHKWLNHPKDDYQKKWMEMKLSGKLESMSLGYQDDPYY